VGLRAKEQRNPTKSSEIGEITGRKNREMTVKAA
jgi:hypothetical protein